MARETVDHPMRPSPGQLISAIVSVALIGYVLSAIDLAEIAREFRELSLLWLAGILILLAGNLLGVSWRLHRLLSHFGAPQSFGTAFRANVSGLASSLIMISLVGSVLGRQFTLRRQGVSPSLLTVLTGYERIVLAAIGAGLSLLGGLAIFGTQFWTDVARNLPAGQTMLSILLAGALALYLIRHSLESRVLARILRRSSVSSLVEISLITITTQALSISTYALAFMALGQGISPWLLLAGAAMVSFAASLPLSVNGWGVREVAAIAVFGHLGATPQEAVAASVLVGLCSTLAVLVATPYALISNQAPESETSGSASLSAMRGIVSSRAAIMLPADRYFDKVLAIMSGMGAAACLFFQIRLSIAGSAVTVNLADPIALSALAAIIAYAVFQRRLPINLPRPALLWLGALSVLLVVGFFVGFVDFGVTSWAVSNRLFGWVVLLGYVTCGALMASQFGKHGARTLVVVLGATAAAVVLVRGTVFMIHYSGLQSFEGISNFEGYSANRNAFALQLMLVCIALTAMVGPSAPRTNFFPLGLIAGILAFGVFYTGSKLGLFVLVCMICGLVLLRARLTGWAARSLLLAIVLALCVAITPDALNAAARLLGLYQGSSIASHILARPIEPLTPGTVGERLVSVRAGLELWLSNPLIGSGLGAAIRLNLGENGAPLVIHSTPIWILAEFGLVGMAVVLSLPVYLLWRTRRRLWDEIRQRRLSRHHLAVLGVCGAFAMFGLGHEIAYQRLFWLLFGAFAASAITSRSEARAEVSGAGRG